MRGAWLAQKIESAHAIPNLEWTIEFAKSIDARSHQYVFFGDSIRHKNGSRIDDAWRCICEAVTFIDSTKERWWEAEVQRTAGEIARQSPDQDAVKTAGYFENALTVARRQHAKSWELRASMSMARLWRDQGKRAEARELLAPVYGWFTEGFDTLDLKEAKALLDELSS